LSFFQEATATPANLTPNERLRRPPPPRRNAAHQRREDFLIAMIAGLLAWIITLFLKTVFSG
jgi:hypothetical protein